MGSYYIEYSWVNFTDMPFAILLLISFLLCLRLLRDAHSPWRGALLELSLGFTYLVRPEGFQIASLTEAELGLLAMLV